ncbi:FecCD family ABC transporter permease [Desertibaculum subflavum]|uniref:FecCD family ABC transporter permease n=1 Tax=Desertibaculum subflavum TaxID=2268458 RepID=UPI000E6640E2
MKSRQLAAILGLIAATLFAAAMLMPPAGATFTPPADADLYRVILVEVRLPRALLAAMLGASLAVAGAALQGFLGNPLAEPGIIGIGNGAAFGAVLVLYYQPVQGATLLVPVGGLAGAGLALLALQGLAGRRPSPLALVLAGVAVAAFTGALTALALNLAPSPFAALEIMFWLMGSVADRSLQHVWLAAPFVVIGLFLLFRLRPVLDALTLGEDVARTLGHDLGRARWMLLGGTAAAVGAMVAVAGAVGFVGLVVPHLLRRAAGNSPAALLLPSAFGGAALVLAADLIVRAVPLMEELKLGVVTALVGAPFFLNLLRRFGQSQP